MISYSKAISLVFLFVGIFALMQVVLPVLSLEVWGTSLKYSNQLLISPQLPEKGVLGVSIENSGNFPKIVSSLKRESQPSYNQFSLSVPSIKLSDVPVLVDSNDFSGTLAHLPGSALPGEKGNSFISGHSASSWLFGQSKEAYFAKLQDIKKGDQILLSAGGSLFKYQVIELRIVDPTDLSVIFPPEPLGRYISLMTCVPPGINTKRLIVLGKMI